MLKAVPAASKTERIMVMIDVSQIKEQMEVKGSDGKHIGTVDGVEGTRVRLASGGMYHYIDIAVVDKVEEGAICLTQSAEETTRTWH
jgi:hypothetical protein